MFKQQVWEGRGGEETRSGFSKISKDLLSKGHVQNAYLTQQHHIRHCLTIRFLNLEKVHPSECATLRIADTLFSALSILKAFLQYQNHGTSSPVWRVFSVAKAFQVTRYATRSIVPRLARIRLRRGRKIFFFFRSRTTPERINISWLISVPRYQSNIFHLSFDVFFEIEKEIFTKTRKRERETVSR